MYTFLDGSNRGVAVYRKLALVVAFISVGILLFAQDTGTGAA